MSVKIICRACLSESKDMRSLFAVGRIMGKTLNLAQLLVSCANLRIAKNDGLPQKICLDCIQHVSNAFTFKIQCERNEQHLLDTMESTASTMPDSVQSELNTSIETQHEKKDQQSLKKASKTQLEVVTQTKENEQVATVNKLKGDTKIEKVNKNATKLNKTGESNAINAGFVQVFLNNNKACVQQKGTKIAETKEKKLASATTGISPIKRSTIIKFKCTLCKRAFSSLSYLKDHQKRKHNMKPDLIKCKLCDKAFRDKEQMKRHINIHDTGKPLKCELCEKAFTQKADYVAHIYSHTGERPFLCSRCGKGFKRNSELIIHTRMHTDSRPYHCDTCGKKFRTSSTFAIHKRTHSGERPFACTFCDKKFKSGTCLKTHTLIHTGEKPHSCEYCGRGFIKSYSLNVHRMIHTCERPHVCSICGKGFIQAHCLRTHMNTHKSSV